MPTFANILTLLQGINLTQINNASHES